jgi:hypothetical protein
MWALFELLRPPILLQLGSQSGDSINRSLALSAASVLSNLTQQMLNGLSRIGFYDSLRSLDSGNLEALEKFRCLDS